MKLNVLLTVLVFAMSALACGRSNNSGTAGEIPADLIAAKKLVREEIKAAEILEIETSSEANDSLERFFNLRDLKVTGGRVLKNLKEIENLGFTQSEVAQDVWSGYTWSEYRGHTAQRYSQRPARDASNWNSAWRFVSDPLRLFSTIASNGSSDEINELSPAEKYDLLISPAREVGAGFLTSHQWEEGRIRQEADGKVAKWYGYCHGWSAAATSLLRPTRTVQILAADQRNLISLTPTDIKGLATALWANALPKLRTLGGRCDSANPKKDKSGRVTDEKCLDVNPGVFHLALVNQLANVQRPLIIDATYDIEIWNQPILKYTYSYFNLATGRYSSAMEEALIVKSDYRRDPFAKYRSETASFIVGIKLEIEYKKSLPPTSAEFDSASDDQSKTVSYKYDLELNEAGEVIGGEWHQSSHPDFVWTTSPGAMAASAFDGQIRGRWDARAGAVPEQWRDAAKQAGLRGQPLASIVYSLIALSQSALN